ncbi:hypothetical protein SARC_10089, partial [Sphaeroforma arctica JP610]
LLSLSPNNNNTAHNSTKDTASADGKTRGRGRVKGRRGMRADHSDPDDTSTSDESEASTTGPREIDSSVYYTTSMHDRERRRESRKTRRNGSHAYYSARDDPAARRRSNSRDTGALGVATGVWVGFRGKWGVWVGFRGKWADNTYKPFQALQASVPNAAALLATTNTNTRTRTRARLQPHPRNSTRTHTHSRDHSDRDTRATRAHHSDSGSDHSTASGSDSDGFSGSDSDAGNHGNHDSADQQDSESDGRDAPRTPRSHARIRACAEEDSCSSETAPHTAHSGSESASCSDSDYDSGSGSGSHSNSWSGSGTDYDTEALHRGESDVSDLETYLSQHVSVQTPPRDTATRSERRTRTFSGSRSGRLPYSDCHSNGAGAQKLFDPSCNKFVDVTDLKDGHHGNHGRPALLGHQPPNGSARRSVERQGTSHSNTHTHNNTHAHAHHSTRAQGSVTRTDTHKERHTHAHRSIRAHKTRATTRTDDRVSVRHGERNSKTAAESTSAPKSKAKKRPRSTREKAIALCDHATRTGSKLREVMRKAQPRDDTARRRIAQLSTKCASAYLQAFLTDIKYAHSFEADKKLWREAFYAVVEMYRRFVRQLRDVMRKKETTSFYDDDFDAFQDAAKAMVDAVNRELAVFIESSQGFYQSLVNQLEVRYHFSLQLVEGIDYTFAGYGEPLWLYARNEGENTGDEAASKGMTFAQLTCHHSFVALGDLGRYYQQHQHTDDPDHTQSVRHYACARALAPKNSRPYNQLGVIATYQDSLFQATYFFVRSLAVKVPFMTARDTLLNVFEKVRVMVLENAPVVLTEPATTAATPHAKAAHSPAEVWLLWTGLVWMEGVDKLRYEPYSGQESTLVQHCADDRDTDTPLDQQTLDKDIWRLGGVETVCWRFVHHSLYVHATLFTRVGLGTTRHFMAETVRELNVLLHTHDSQPWLAAGCLVELMGLCMFSIHERGPGNPKHVVKGHEQPNAEAKSEVLHGMAVHFATELFVLLVTALTNSLSDDFLASLGGEWDEVRDGKDGQLNRMLSLPMTESQFSLIRLVLPALKVYCDWLINCPALWLPILGSSKCYATDPELVRKFWVSVSRLGYASAKICGLSSDPAESSQSQTGQRQQTANSSTSGLESGAANGTRTQQDKPSPKALWEDRLLAGLVYLTEAHAELSFENEPPTAQSNNDAIPGDDVADGAVRGNDVIEFSDVERELLDDALRWKCLARFTNCATRALGTVPNPAPNRDLVQEPAEISHLTDSPEPATPSRSPQNATDEHLVEAMRMCTPMDVMDGLLYYDPVAQRLASDPAPLVAQIPKRSENTEKESIGSALDNVAPSHEASGVPQSVNGNTGTKGEPTDDIADLLRRKEYLQTIMSARDRSREAVQQGLQESISATRVQLCVTPEYVCFDTNLWIDHLQNIVAMVEGRRFKVLCPLVVVNELRGLAKSERVQAKAERAVSYLETAFQSHTHSQATQTLLAVTAQGTLVHNIRFSNEDNPDGLTNDDLILGACVNMSERTRGEINAVNPATACAPQVDRLDRHVVLVTDDINVRVKATAKTIPTRSFASFVRLLSMASLSGVQT